MDWRHFVTDGQPPPSQFPTMSADHKSMRPYKTWMRRLPSIRQLFNTFEPITVICSVNTLATAYTIQLPTFTDCRTGLHYGVPSCHLATTG